MMKGKALMINAAAAAVFMSLLVLFPFGMKAQARTAQTISQVEISVSAPSAGTSISANEAQMTQSPYPRLGLPSGKGYRNFPYGQPAFWLTSPNTGTPELPLKAGTVQQGETLYAYACVVAEEGYTFSDGVQVVVQGGQLINKAVFKGVNYESEEAMDQLVVTIKVTVSGGSSPAPAAPHEHNFEWEITKEPTEFEDGEKAYVCSICGAVEQRLPITGFMVFLEKSAKAVANAAPGAEVDIETGLWLSFDSSVLDAIAARPDVAVKITFRYKGEWYTVTIPAGSDISALKNEEGYAGFLYLGSVFGCTPLDR